MSDHTDLVLTPQPFKAEVHPGAVSKLTVKSADGSVQTVYEQKVRHDFPNGERHPQQHVIRLQGGPHQRNLTLTVHDPLHHVARITVELYPPTRDPMSKDPAPEPVETMTADNDPLTCPPHCE